VSLKIHSSLVSPLVVSSTKNGWGHHRLTTVTCNCQLLHGGIFKIGKLALSRMAYKPLCWFHYFDYTFVVWSHGPEKLNDFFNHLINHLNSIPPNIQLTMETELDGHLLFLTLIHMEDHVAPWVTLYAGGQPTPDSFPAELEFLSSCVVCSNRTATVINPSCSESSC
jgi:hypothetical protein